MKKLLLALATFAVLTLGIFVTTGVSLIPPPLALGSCFKDWTSPVSYQPRASALAGIRFSVADAKAQLCYGRPIRNGRTIFGGLVPWGEPWRLGANEPTRLSVTKAVRLAGISLPPGRYSLYVEPQPDQWTVYVTRSTTHWGNDISKAVRAEEIGSAVVPVEPLAEVVDTFTAKIEDRGATDRVALVFEWERTRVMLELSRATVSSNLGVLQ